jgi:hypothetical protein
LSSQRNIITDGATQIIENLIVTTIPYHCSKEQKSVWLDRGFTIRRQTGNIWLVLHHVPPMTGSDASGEEREAAELLVNYHPDYFVSGHAHAFPYMSGQSWHQAVYGARVLVPGQLFAGFGSELYSAQSGTRGGELAHFERKVDPRRRALRTSYIESPEGLRGALSLWKLIPKAQERIAQAAAKKSWEKRKLPNWRDRVDYLLKGRQIITGALRLAISLNQMKISEKIKLLFSDEMLTQADQLYSQSADCNFEEKAIEFVRPHPARLAYTRVA